MCNRVCKLAEPRVRKLAEPRVRKLAEPQVRKLAETPVRKLGMPQRVTTQAEIVRQGVLEYSSTQTATRVNASTVKFTGMPLLLLEMDLLTRYYLEQTLRVMRLWSHISLVLSISLKNHVSDTFYSVCLTDTFDTRRFKYHSGMALKGRTRRSDSSVD